MRIGTCFNCNKDFRIIHKQDKFCSAECYFIFRNKPEKRICNWCKKEFISNEKFQKYCSRSCNSYSYRNGKSRNRHLKLNIIRQEKYAYKFPVKIKAQKILQYSVLRGYIIRPDYCEKCLEKCKPQGHHQDYSKPLEVRWLCAKCHKQEHICLSA